MACIIQRHNARIVLESRIQSERHIEKSIKAQHGSRVKIKSAKPLNGIARSNSAGTAAQRSISSSQVQPIRRVASAMIAS